LENSPPFGHEDIAHIDVSNFPVNFALPQSLLTLPKGYVETLLRFLSSHRNQNLAVLFDWLNVKFVFLFDFLIEMEFLWHRTDDLDLGKLFFPMF
jgi:hypothetical protein